MYLPYTVVSVRKAIVVNAFVVVGRHSQRIDDSIH